MNVSTPLFSSSTTNIDDFVDIDTKFDFELVKLLIENAKELVNDYL